MKIQLAEAATKLPANREGSTTFWPIAGRIAYVVSHSYPYSSNGYAVRTHGIASALVQHGLSVVAINRPGRPWDLPGYTGNGFKLHHEIDGVRYHFIPRPSCRGLSQAGYFDAAARALKETLQVFKPSVVMAASNWENAAPALEAARELRLPFWYEVRGFWELSQASRSPGWENTAQFKEAVERETTVAQKADRLFTLNWLMRDELARRGVDARKIELLPNAYNPWPRTAAEFVGISREAFGCKARYLVGYVGSFTEYEGLDDLIRVCAGLRRTGLDLALMLVGSSNPVGINDPQVQCAMSANFRALARELGFAEHLILPGRRPSTDLPDVYSLLDLVVIPRKPSPIARLVSPLKPFEAAAFGKCLLMSDVDALRALREILPGSVYFKAGSIDHMAATISNLLRDPHKRTISAAANGAAALNLTWPAATSDIAGLIKRDFFGASRIPVRRTISESQLHVGEISLSGGLGEQVQLSEKTLWCQFRIEATDYAKLYLEVIYDGIESSQRRKALVVVEYLDADGKPVVGPYKNFKKSQDVGWFQYLAPPEMPGEEVATLDPPSGASSVRVGFCTFMLKGAERVFVGSRLRIRWHDNHADQLEHSEASLNHHAIPCLPFEAPIPAAARKLRVASIFDSFSHACFEPECDLIPITPTSLRQQLLDHEIDMLFVESAWHGNSDSWLYRVASYSKPPGNELSDVIRWAKKFGIPTVFWNKEDPPNFDRFIERATEFDFIFTTDENCIERYRARVRAETRVEALPFAAQPKIHHPRLEQPRLNATSFAGTYYADDFEPRRRAMDMLLRVSARYGLDIFDRMYSVTGKDKARFQFPNDLQDYVRGSLSYDEMLAAYRRYRVSLNVNSVSDSPTMFSRRVFELLACGTPVVSTQSLGIDELFGGLVPTVETELEAQDVLSRLMTDGGKWLRSSTLGLRAVFGAHTYAHRVEKICVSVGLSTSVVPRRDLVIVLHAKGNPQNFAEMMKQQTEQPVEIVIAGISHGSLAMRRHAEAINAVGIKASCLPHENVTSYLRNRHPRAVIAICDSRHYYGPRYLLDARIAISGSPDVHASTIHPKPDLQDYLRDTAFDTPAQIGVPTKTAFGGSVVLSADNPLLANALNSGSDEGYFEVGHQFHTRAWFEFLPFVRSTNVMNPTLIDLNS